MNTLDDQNLNDLQRHNKASGDQAPRLLPLYASGDSMVIENSTFGSTTGVVPTLDAQGSINEEILKSLLEKEKGSVLEDIPLIEGDRTVKKKRRQEKNREAAQLFRQRQKARVHELERSVDELTCNNSEFRMKMEILAFENKILKDQLFYLKNLVSAGILITSAPTGSSFPLVPNLEKSEASTIMSTLPPASTFCNPSTLNNNSSGLGNCGSAGAHSSFAVGNNILRNSTCDSAGDTQRNISVNNESSNAPPLPNSSDIAQRVSPAQM